MTGIKKQIVLAIKVLGIMAFVAALAATAFPSSSYAASAGANGKITLAVSSQVTGQTIDNAGVVVYDAKGNVVLKADLSRTDMRTFAVPVGQFKVVVTAKGYEGQTQTVTVGVSENQLVSFALKPNSVPGGVSSIGTGK